MPWTIRGIILTVYFINLRDYMFRKLLFICSVFVMCLLFSGCTKVIELTDEETKVIAEYAADLLLKYDISFEDRLDEGERKIAKDEEKALTSEAALQGTTNQEVTEELMTEATTEASKDLSGKIEEDTSVSEDDVVTLHEKDIAPIVGISGASITCKDYIITDQYPATDEEGKFLYLEASEGYDLLVVRFDVIATGEDAVNVSLIDKEIDYKIVCNGSKAANPMLTILMDDLGTLETIVNPGEPQEAVLVFQVATQMKDALQSVRLDVTYNGTQNSIDIQ